MALFDDIGKKISQTGQNAVQKTKNMADAARMNSMVAEEEKRITAYYLQLGQLYVSEYGEDAQSKFPDLVNQLYASQNRVIELKEQIQGLKGFRKCPSCGASVPENAAFCNVCGASVAVMPQMDTSNMLMCPSCGKYVEKGMKFCVACGAPMVAPAPAGAHVCAQCGNVLEEGMVFCNQCGAKYEQAHTEPMPPVTPQVPSTETGRICVQCGNVLEEGMAFCNQCGTKYVEPQAEAVRTEPAVNQMFNTPVEPAVVSPVAEPVENDVAQAAEPQRVCTQCGNVLEAGVVFCTTCGTKYEEAQPVAEPAEPVAQVRSCPNCGNELAPDVMFCTRCGTKVE